jgi:hypothetical protein
VGFEVRRKAVVDWIFERCLGVTGRTERVCNAAGIAVCFDEVAAFDVRLQV